MIAGILLAAGKSTRFGTNKLLHPLADGTPLVMAALLHLRHQVDEVIVVVSPDDAATQNLLAREQVRLVACRQSVRGMGASIACGVLASPDADGWLIALGDMPSIPPELIAELAARLKHGAAIVAPSLDGKRGHPVGFGREFFESLSHLDGDAGARTILETHTARVELVPTHHSGVLLDIDVPGDLQALP